MSRDIIREEINDLKQKLNATILAHFYEDGEIQDIADYVGDSYFLAQKGQESQAQLILLAGVVFMAESVKILNPEKRVIVPDLQAGCSLVESSPFEAYRQWRLKNKNAIAVTYINSSAEVKAISDVICTSSNAEKIINSIPKDRPILFGPDQNLGRFLSKKLNRSMEFWNGSCFVHVIFSAQKLLDMILENPEAIVLAHPECTSDVLKQAQVIGSTSRLIDEVKNNKAKKFIVATEAGIFHQMKKIRPDAELLQAPTAETCGCNNCPYMKLNTLEKIRDALLKLQPEIHLKTELMERAARPLQRMMDISSGKAVKWPDEFEDFQIIKSGHSK